MMAFVVSVGVAGKHARTLCHGAPRAVVIMSSGNGWKGQERSSASSSRPPKSNTTYSSGRQARYAPRDGGGGGGGGGNGDRPTGARRGRPQGRERSGVREDATAFAPRSGDDGDWDSDYGSENYGRPYGAQAERDTYASQERSRLQKLIASSDDFLYGVSSVLAALSANRRTFHALFIQDSIDLTKRKDKTSVEKLNELAAKRRVRVEYMNKGDLNNLSGGRPHQGFILQADPLEFVPLPELPPIDQESASTRMAPLWLILDETQDPMNLGALLRTSWFLRVDGVAVCTKNSCGLSATASKASAGALELMPVHSVSNMPKFLQAAKQCGWRVLGTSLDKSAVDARSIVLDQPTILLLGNEGHGLRTMVAKECDAHVRIQTIRGSEQVNDIGTDTFVDTVDSLNVSVSGGMLLYQLLGK
ncbi:rRNA methyltransferase 1, mitochondrial [Porphyridium purpureum]|uniref:rRNA methyltransferase 1, mitochondrial n=1 Tax=Porphyridium purpureum TaxID=35688 RepID=A0A5J4YQ81_PORPP|nr:rRNA methyltransferase 1, mitochondrial [Porphyridium purpureum]|eukprot:POR2936..scf222_8